MAHQCLWHRCIDCIHRHVISVVSRPAKCKLRQISGSDDHSAGLICNIHQNLRALSRLSVLVGHVMHRRILSDIPEMNVDGIFDIHLDKISSQTADQ